MRLLRILPHQRRLDMKELINAYKIVGYGAKIKTQFFMAALFLALGILFEIMSGGTQSTGSFYIVLSGLFLYQMIVSSDISTLVQSSPYKKKIQCVYPMIAVMPWVFVTLNIVLLIHYFFAKNSDAAGLQAQCQTLVVLGLCIFIMLVYFGLAYKLFVTATVVMIIFVMVIMFATSAVFNSENAPELTFAGCAIFNYVCTIGGCLACKGLTELLYKLELSSYAFRGLIKKKS